MRLRGGFWEGDVVQRCRAMVCLLSLLYFPGCAGSHGSTPGDGATVFGGGQPADSMSSTGTNQPQRQTPIYWGTNAVLYDAQDVSLIESLGNRGKVSARVTYYWSDIEQIGRAHV